MPLNLTPLTPGTTTLSPNTATGSFQFVTTQAVTAHQNPSNVVPAGTTAFEVDASGNVLAGQNTFVPSRTGTDQFYVPQFLFSPDKRTFYTNCVKIAQVSDPPDLVLGRTGPASGLWGTVPTGVQSGNCLGQHHFQGWVTPQGGTPGVTTGGGWNGASVRLQAYATEDYIQVAGTWQQGGELRIQTTPKLSNTPVDRVAVTDAGVVVVIGNSLSKAQAEVFGVLGDIVGGRRVYATDRIVAKKDPGNGTSATQVTLGDVGPGSEAGIAFHSSLDLRVYRDASANFASNANVVAWAANAAQVQVGRVGPSNEAGLVLGTSNTANLYLSAADTLKTDDSLHVAATFRHLGTSLGFYNHATATQQTVTGSRGGNAALASLLTALAASGLIVDSSTA